MSAHQATTILTKSKSKPSIPCMLCGFISSDIRTFKARLSNKIHRRAVPYVATADYAIPDSVACQRALELVTAVSPPFLLNHCLRSYCFGLAMAHKVKRPIDKEVFFLGSIMHDLGLTEKFQNEDTFEISGAQAAHAFALDQNVEDSRAALIHEMVALHNSVGIADKKEPEIALLHFGAGVDVAGLWIADVHKKTLEEVLEQYPNIGFKEGMIELIADQIEQKPHSYMATMVKLGFFKKMRKAPF